MATVHPQELLAQWSRESITAEMATGQIIQHLVALQVVTEGLQHRVAALQREVDQLTSGTATPQIRGQRKASQRQ
jgi:hypothetical protein